MDLSERGTSTTRHPWEQARAAFFVDVLADHRLLADAPRILDVGAGDGYFAGRVRERSPGAAVALWDLHYGARDLAELAAAGFLPSTTKPAGPFDIVMLLDVAEHVADDHAFLADVLASAAPGAHVLFSVPAWPLLFSSHDDALRHHRRYRPREARALLEGAGLHVLEAGGMFHSLMAPRAFSLANERLRGREARRDVDGDAPAAEVGVGAWRGGAVVTAAITAVLRGEQRVSRALSSRGIDAPGLSWWALARR